MTNLQTSTLYLKDDQSVHRLPFITNKGIIEYALPIIQSSTLNLMWSNQYKTWSNLYEAIVQMKEPSNKALQLKKLLLEKQFFSYKFFTPNSCETDDLCKAFSGMHLHFSTELNSLTLWIKQAFETITELEKRISNGDCPEKDQLAQSIYLIVEYMEFLPDRKFFSSNESFSIIKSFLTVITHLNQPSLSEYISNQRFVWSKPFDLTKPSGIWENIILASTSNKKINPEIWKTISGKELFYDEIKSGLYQIPALYDLIKELFEELQEQPDYSMLTAALKYSSTMCYKNHPLVIPPSIKAKELGSFPQLEMFSHVYSTAFSEEKDRLSEEAGLPDTLNENPSDFQLISSFKIDKYKNFIFIPSPGLEETYRRFLFADAICQLFKLDKLHLPKVKLLTLSNGKKVLAKEIKQTRDGVDRYLYCPEAIEQLAFFLSKVQPDNIEIQDFPTTSDEQNIVLINLDSISLERRPNRPYATIRSFMARLRNDTQKHFKQGLLRNNIVF